MLSPEPIASCQDPHGNILRIITEISDSKSSIAKQVNRFLTLQGDIHTGSFWDSIAASEDTLTAFSDPYRDLLQRVESVLPRAGSTVLDLGAGTLNFSLFALMKCRERRLVAVDFSRRSLQQGRRKLNLFLDGEAKDVHRWVALTLPNPRFVSVQADAALLINVLYTINDKRAALEMAKANLKPGGKLIIVDPTPRFRSAEKVKKFLLELSTSAVQNHSPMNDFDLALVSAVYLRKLTRGRGEGARPSFIKTQDLIALAQGQNFEALSVDPVYAGSSRMLLLRNHG